MSNTGKSVAGRSALPLIIFFTLSTVVFIAAGSHLQQWGISPVVAGIGNLILFIVTFISFYLYQRAMVHPTTMGFLRNTYSGLFFKLLVCAIVMAAYVLSDKKHVNKPGIYICVFLYFIYTLLEMRSLMQWNKARRNA